MPYHQVRMFQKMAPKTPHITTDTDKTVETSLRLMNLPMVFATAVPPRRGPRNSKQATIATACTGVIAREAIMGAIMFAAS